MEYFHFVQNSPAKLNAGLIWTPKLFNLNSHFYVDEIKQILTEVLS